MAIMQRPFGGCIDMCENLLENHNSLVKEDDEVIVVGDVVSKTAVNFDFWLELLPKFNGKKTLIRGNHDETFSDEKLAPYFEKIVPEGEGIEMEVEEIPVYVTHYPTAARSDRFNLVGHVHGAWKYQLNSLNVGVDVHHYRPVSLASIPFHFKAVSEVYDADVWAAYHPANAEFVGKRGKPGSYFPPTGPDRGGK
jgi:calcineurin-like phosphoesterase family protein